MAGSDLIWDSNGLIRCKFFYGLHAGQGAGLLIAWSGEGLIIRITARYVSGRRASLVEDSMCLGRNSVVTGCGVILVGLVGECSPLTVQGKGLIKRCYDLFFPRDKLRTFMIYGLQIFSLCFAFVHYSRYKCFRRGQPKS